MPRSIAQLKEQLKDIRTKAGKKTTEITTEKTYADYITNHSFNIILVLSVIVIIILLFIEGKSLLKKIALAAIVFLFIGSAINLFLNGTVFHFSHFLHTGIGIVFLLVFAVLIFRETDIVKSAEKILIQAAFIIFAIVLLVTVFVSYNFYESTEAFRNELNDIIDDLKDNLSELNKIKDDIKKAVSGTKDFLIKVFGLL